MPGVVNVTTPPTASALTTVAAVKAALGITVSTYDSRLTTLVAAASALIASTLCRTLGRYTAAETFRTRGARSLVLSADRVTVTGVTLDGVALVAGTDYEAAGGSGVVYRLAGGFAADWRGVVVVTYSAGWILPGVNGADLPAEIEAEAVGLVKAAYLADGADPNVISETVEETGTIRFAQNGVTGMGAVSPTLEPYRLRV